MSPLTGSYMIIIIMSPPMGLYMIIIIIVSPLAGFSSHLLLCSGFPTIITQPYVHAEVFQGAPKSDSSTKGPSLQLNQCGQQRLRGQIPGVLPKARRPRPR